MERRIAVVIEVLWSNNIGRIDDESRANSKGDRGCGCILPAMFPHLLLQLFLGELQNTSQLLYPIIIHNKREREKERESEKINDIVVNE